VTEPGVPEEHAVAGHFRRARVRAQLTQERLAELADVSVRTVRNIEAGATKPRADSLVALAGVLGIDPDPQADAEEPWQLPARVARFTGREEAFRQLDAVLRRTDRRLAVIYGTAGVGKTALALHWAHERADAFPDGQLYADVRGFDPAGSSAAPEEVLHRFLTALHVPPARIRGQLDELTALFRTIVRGRKMLVLLDNARDVEQVTPLLPGDPEIMVIVTSRAPLTRLVTTAGAVPVRLDVLDGAAAKRLLIGRLGEACIEGAGADAVAAIVARCAGLPLALAVVAGRVTLRPGVPVAVTAAELIRSTEPLDVLGRWDPDTNVQAVFSWSYRALSRAAGRLFRLLGLHFGPEISVPAAASLAGLPPARARMLLAELTAASLVTEQPSGRFTQHDLLRAYARQLTDEHDPDARQAIQRVLDHYVHTAVQAAMLVNPGRNSITPEPPAAGVIIEPLTDLAEARSWLDAEVTTLIDGVHSAAGHGFDEASWHLAWSIVDLLDRHGRWPEWLRAQLTALAAARRRPGVAPEAHVHQALAQGYGSARQFTAAHTHLDRAIALFAAGGDGRREARCRITRAWLLEREDRRDDALRAAEETLRVMQARGDQRGLGTALNGVGWALVLTGRYQRAVELCAEAVTVEQQIGTPIGVANALDSLGCACLGLQRTDDAIRHLEHAIGLYRDLGNRYYELLATDHLGNARAAQGDHDAARRLWHNAVIAFTDLDPRQAATIQAKLDRLPQSEASNAT
jgi:transcriptional regulator with XRE-family HTH domain/tetratricopeptide (TPR) repeat protein